MEGITILNEIDTTEGLPIWILIIGILSIISLIVHIIFSIKTDDFSGLALSMIFIGAMIGLQTGILIKSGFEHEVHRKEVIIDKNVSYTELTNKYNVIEQRGEIYVIEEKVED